MAEPTPPPGTRPPATPLPASKASGFRTAEARLASAVIRLVSVLRTQPNVFPVAYDTQKTTVWGNLLQAKQLHVFASDFFDDLLEIAAHRLAVMDITPAHRERLREAGLLGALRHLQAGDLKAGLARMRAFADAEAGLGTSAKPGDLPAAGTRAQVETGAPSENVGTRAPAGDATGLAFLDSIPPEHARETVLTPGRLRTLRDALRNTEPRVAAAVQELETLLESDPTSTTGASAGMLVHLTSGDPRLHPGYGLWMTLRCAAEVVDRRSTTALALNKIETRAAGMLHALTAASVVSRASRGPALERGLRIHLEADGLEEFVSGESADLAFALLFASEARSAGSLRRLVVPPGTAAIGEIQPDALIREVAAGPLRAKLRRLWESGVRRLYVPAAQEELCRGIFAEMGGAVRAPGGGSGTDPNAAGSTEPDPGQMLRLARCDRWIGIVPARRLEDVALPHHFQLEQRSVADWVHRTVRRNRVRVEVAGAALAAVLAVLAALYVFTPIQNITRDGDQVLVHYGPVKREKLDIQVPQGHLRFVHDTHLETKKWKHYVWWPKVRGKTRIYAVSVHSVNPNDQTGAIRIDCLNAARDTLWHDYIDADMVYGPQAVRYHANEMSVSHASMADWDGDQRPDFIVAATNQHFPSVVTIWNDEGQRLLQYVHAGHVKSFTLVPAPFVLSDSVQPPAGFRGEWRQRSCLVGLAYRQPQPDLALFVLPPWVVTASSPHDTPGSAHSTLPGCEAPYVRIPPSLVAIRLNNGRSHPDRVEFVAGDGTVERAVRAASIRLGTIEAKGEGPIVPGSPLPTLIRKFGSGPGLVQYSVGATDEFREAAQRAGIALEDTALARSVETLHSWEDGRWVTRRAAAWLR